MKENQYCIDILDSFKRLNYENSILANRNYEAADIGEGSSASSKDEIIKGLNEDLAREYKAII
jgi:hypothetical protein